MLHGEAKDLSRFGVVQLPPASIAQGGSGAGCDGYEVFEYRNLDGTRYGSKEELMAAIAALQIALLRAGRIGPVFGHALGVLALAFTRLAATAVAALLAPLIATFPAAFRAACDAGRRVAYPDREALFAATLECRALGVLGIAVEAAAERRNAKC